MPKTAELLTAGWRWHQAGDLVRAEQSYRQLVEQEIADLARLLVSKSENELFGETEFQVRDLVLRVGVKAFQEHLREKKRLSRLLGRLPGLRTKCGVSRLSAAPSSQHSWPPFSAARLLLLPSLRRPISLG